MASEWQVGRLGDHVDSCLGKMLDKKKNKGDLLPYLGNKNVRWGSFEFDELAQMPFQEHELERYGLEAGDLIVCEGGEPGRCAIWEGQVPSMKIQKALHRIRPHNNLNNRFLFYWFLWAGKTGQLDSHFTGTTIQHLTGKALANLQIPIPPLDIQENISNCLGALDKKIQLNRQTNQTLEQMAQALFKSWFVDFDPVIDNALAAGNPIPDALQARAQRRQQQLAKPDHKPLPKEFRQLFPCEFEQTEALGWVPKGWRYLAADQVFDVGIGKTPPRKQAEWFSVKKEGNHIWVSIRDMGSVGAHVSNSSEYLTSEAVDKFRIKVVPQDSVLLSFKLTLGRVSIATCELTTNEAIAHFTNPREGLRKEYVYCYLKNFNFQSLGSTSSIATAVNSKIIKSMPILVPNLDVLSAFCSNSHDWFSRMRTLDAEISSLSNLRDTLLPRLITGELRIPDVEKEVSDAVA